MLKIRQIGLIALLIIFGVPVLGMINNSMQIRRQSMSGMALPGEADSRGAAPTIGTTGNANGATSHLYKDMMAREQDLRMEKAPASTSIVAPEPPMPIPGNDGFVSVPSQDRTIVKTAQLSITADNVREAVDKIQQLATAQTGVVTSATINDNSTYKPGITAHVVLRVPVTKLDETLAQIRKLAVKITSDSVSADDRTKQKVDMDARLKNLKASEDQLLTIMKQAKNVTETLEVQRQLTEIRGQIESLTAQLENLTQDAAMSTVYVSLSTPASDSPIVNPSQNSIFEELKLAVRDTARAYRNLFIGGMRTVIFLLPIIVIGLIAWAIWQRRSKKS